MPIMVVTRLRLRDPKLLDEFFTAAVACLEQSKRAAGSLGGDVFADANDTWWTVSAWNQRASIDEFINAEPHLGTELRMGDWCDEATFVDWEQDSADLPDWQVSYRHLIAEGRSAELSHASPGNDSRAFSPPVAAS